MGVKDTLLNGILSVLTLGTIIVSLAVLEPHTQLYNQEFLNFQLGWIFAALLTIFNSINNSHFTRELLTEYGHRLRDVLERVAAGSDLETDDEEDIYIGKAAPFVKKEETADRVRFRPYDVLLHMSLNAKSNLFEDARTQTNEMWKNHRQEAYNELQEAEWIVLSEFEIELSQRDGENLDLNVIPTFQTSDSSRKADDAIYDLIRDYCADIEIRIIKIIEVHDSISPQ